MGSRGAGQSKLIATDEPVYATPQERAAEEARLANERAYVARLREVGANFKRKERVVK